MSRECIVIGASIEVPMSSFVVSRVIRDGDGKKYLPSDLEKIFVSDGSQASILFGWGIARHSEQTSKTIIIFNPDQQVTFPQIED